jgi:DNA-directed RNA polymerase subunit N (RpoN/RPB10)
MILVYSFIKRNQSRSHSKTWLVRDVERALDDLGMDRLSCGREHIVWYVSKEVPDESGIQERKRIEQRFRMIARDFAFMFNGAF